MALLSIGVDVDCDFHGMLFLGKCDQGESMAL
jgi:hypothetical protein